MWHWPVKARNGISATNTKQDEPFDPFIKASVAAPIFKVGERTINIEYRKIIWNQRILINKSFL